MRLERAKNASRNLIFGILNKIVCLLVPFVLRTIIIYVLGVEYIGLGSLFTSILNILNMVELGISSAIVFNMYSAIAENDTTRICALMKLYKKVYRIIGLIVAVAGLAVMPFLRYLIRGDVPPDVNLYILYGIYLAQAVLTYFVFAYRNSLFTAHQRADITSNVSTIVFTLQYAAQAVFLLVFKNYYVYAVFLPVTTLLNNIILAILAKKKYPDYKPVGELPEEVKKEISKKVKALFLYKLGSVVLLSVDTIVISSFLGLTELGKYNNYYYVITALFGFLTVYYNSMTAGIGNSLNLESYEKNKKDFDRLFFMQGWLIGFCTVCLLCLYQPFIALWVGEDLMFPFGVVICFAIYFYIWKMMDIVNLYKDAAGLWQYDKYRPIIASLVNLTINLILVHFIGIYGILLSTIISILIVILPWSTYVLFKYLFNKNMKKDLLNYFSKYVFFAIITFIACTLTYLICMMVPRGDIVGLIVKGIICLIVPNIIFLFSYSFLKDYKEAKEWGIVRVKRLLKRGKKE